MMFLTKYFKNREYDLEWDRPFAESILIFIVAIFAPYSFSMVPLSLFFVIGLVTYYKWLKPRKNRLGFRMNAKANKAMIILSILYFSFILLLIVLIQDQKYELLMSDERDIFENIYIGHLYDDGWNPDVHFEEAVLTGNVSGALLQVWKPFALIVIQAPIFESIIFFAILFPAVWARYSYRRAMIVTTLVFLICHIPNLDLISIWEYTFFVIVSIILYERTRSIYPLILYHAYGNLITIVLWLSTNWELETVYSGLLR